MSEPTYSYRYRRADSSSHPDIEMRLQAPLLRLFQSSLGRICGGSGDYKMLPTEIQNTCGLYLRHQYVDLLKVVYTDVDDRSHFMHKISPPTIFVPAYKELEKNLPDDVRIAINELLHRAIHTDGMNSRETDADKAKMKEWMEIITSHWPLSDPYLAHNEQIFVDLTDQKNTPENTILDSMVEQEDLIRKQLEVIDAPSTPERERLIATIAIKDHIERVQEHKEELIKLNTAVAAVEKAPEETAANFIYSQICANLSRFDTAQYQLLAEALIGQQSAEYRADIIRNEIDRLYPQKGTWLARKFSGISKEESEAAQEIRENAGQIAIDIGRIADGSWAAFRIRQLNQYVIATNDNMRNYAAQSGGLQLDKEGTPFFTDDFLAKHLKSLQGLLLNTPAPTEQDQKQLIALRPESYNLPYEIGKLGDKAFLAIDMEIVSQGLMLEAVKADERPALTPRSVQILERHGLAVTIRNIEPPRTPVLAAAAPGPA